MPRFKDLTGQKFSRLTAIRTAGRKCNKICWECLCDCGVTKVVMGADLLAGKTKSCGCLSREMDETGARTLKHGKCYSKTYGVWKTMLSRCTNPNTNCAKNYVLRNIGLEDPRWLVFENFYADMGDAPEGLQLDRIDNNRGYCKDNCRWATRTRQCRNKRNNRLIEFNGDVLCVSDWAERLHLDENLLRDRLAKGWDFARAVSTPRGDKNGSV